MRRAVVITLIFVFAFFTPVSLRNQEARANPAVVVVPVAVIAVLAILMAAVLAAKTSGSLDPQAADQLYNDLAEKKRATQDLLNRGVRATENFATELLALAMRTQTPIPLTATCVSPILAMQLARPRTASVTTETRRGGQDRRAVDRGSADRRVTSNCSNFEECCSDFRNFFGDKGSYRNGAFRIFKNNKKNKLLCCYEFDRVHNGLEIFDENGNHLGERGCEMNDFGDEALARAVPCDPDPTRGLHAQPNSATHRPTAGKCGR